MRRSTTPSLFLKSVSENAFQAILKPIFPYTITSILSKVRHSNTFFLTISFEFPCRPLGALVRFTCVCVCVCVGGGGGTAIAMQVCQPNFQKKKQ